MEYLEASLLDEWREWLDDHHNRSPGAWLITFRKGHGPYVPPYDANNIALRYGWYGVRQDAVDDQRVKHLYCPRHRYFPWSTPDRFETNKQVKAGTIHAAGLACVLRAQRDGSWWIEDRMVVRPLPIDLIFALDEVPSLREKFHLLDPTRRSSLLARLAADTGRTKKSREQAIGRLIAVLVQLHVSGRWWADADSVRNEHIKFDLSERLIGMFERAHEAASTLVLTGPPGLSKSWSAAEFVARTPGAAAAAALPAGDDISWVQTQQSLIRSARTLGAGRPDAGLPSVRANAAKLSSAIVSSRTYLRGLHRGRSSPALKITFVLDDAQRLSDDALGRLLEFVDLHAPFPIGLVLIGTPSLRKRLTVGPGQGVGLPSAHELYSLKPGDLSKDDMICFLAAKGLADAALRHRVADQLTKEGAWSLRKAQQAVERLSGEAPPKS